MSVLLDAGPSLNFLAVSQQNILIQLAAANDLQLAAPQRVNIEVEGKAANDPRFKKTAALSTWRTLRNARRVVIMDDELTTRALTDAVARISGVPARDRVRTTKSLGEIMVLAHASVLAQSGEQVFVLIDESDGRRRAGLEQAWLQRHGATGSIVLWNTRDVLREAGRHDGWIVGGLRWEAVYDQMTKFDDGLPKRPRTGGR